MHQATVTHDAITILLGPWLRATMIFAIIADLVQIVVFPHFVAGAESPADDILDLGMGAVLTFLLGWHWAFQWRLPVGSNRASGATEVSIGDAHSKRINFAFPR